MMPSRSTPNLESSRENKNNNAPTSIYSYLHNQSDLDLVPPTCTRDAESPPPAPPVRDSSSLKSIKYGPGHEKFPSWPVPAAAEIPQALRGSNNGGSHRSKSWTDHTNYPKEKVVTYTRPYMKRQHSSMQQKLKPVLEKCEKIPPETFESRIGTIKDRFYLPTVDREGKSLGDMEYMVPSPPERDNNKPQLTQAELEHYARSYNESTIDKFCKYNIKGNLTQAELEEYTRTYEEALTHQHQKQSSYAQSEGYHSYVSSTDSSSTPFLDRLRRDSEATIGRSQPISTWEDLSEHDGHTRREGRDSVVTTSSGSASSSETLKWHGSMSDVSVASSSFTQSANSSMSKQLIVHSARVQTPQKLHTESVSHASTDIQISWKDKEDKKNKTNKLKLFAVNTYTVEPSDLQQEQNSRLASLSPSLQSLSVADRIHELEKQQKYSYLDPNKRHRIPDPTLKAIQKKALLSFYERHHLNSNKNSTWRSEPQLAKSQPTITQVPQPPPRIKIQTPSRRASSASDYASTTNSRRSSLSSRDVRVLEGKLTPRHQHSNSCGSLSTDLMGPIIVGPSISVDDWVPDKPPERPPKNPNLRNTFPDLFKTVHRLPSPDLPPPSPPTVLDDEVFHNDEPLPPPPPEIQQACWQEQFTTGGTNEYPNTRQYAEPQVDSNNKSKDSFCDTSLHSKLVKESIVELPSSGHKLVHVQNDKTPLVSSSHVVPSQKNGFPSTRMYPERLSMRYPSVPKVPLHGAIAVSQKVVRGFSQQFRAEPLRPRNENKNDDFAKASPHLQTEIKVQQRASIAEGSSREVPPPLQPRQMRINQSMRARIPERMHHNGNTKLSPPKKDQLKEFSSRNIQYPMSHSKASYLASRRERERIVPDSDTGIYKRTSSPNGHILTDSTPELSNKINSRDTKWPTKEVLLHNNTNLIRRVSMTEKSNIIGNHLSLRCDGNEDFRKNQVVLPDVLPVKEKFISHRPQFAICPVANENELNLHKKPKSPPKYTSPPCSPTKNPTRNGSFTPIRSNNFITSPIKTISCNSVLSTSTESTTVTSSTPNSKSPSFSLSTPSLNSIQNTETDSKLGCFISPVSSKYPETSPTIKSASSDVTSSPALLALSSSRTPPPMRDRTSPSAVRISPPDIRNSPLVKTPPAISTSPPKSPLQSNLSKSHTPPLDSPKSSRRSSPMISTSTNTPLHISPTNSPPPSPKMFISSISSCEENDESLPVVEGLQMIQRTEVILRVNVSTTDAASQTDKDELLTPLPTRKKLQEEIECEKLSLDLIKQLPESDKLKEILRPDIKKSTDYICGLFRPDVTSKPRPTNSPFRSRTTTPNCSPTPSIVTNISNSSVISNSKTEISIVPSLEPSSPLSPTSTYFTTSEPKAKFLTRYSQDMNNQFNFVKDTKDLDQKKMELMNRLDRKLEVLRGEQLILSEECRVNDELGENVEIHMNKLARPHETAKFRLHVEEVGKITSLLLGLSGRLARAENALMSMSVEDPEKPIMESKKEKLKQQLQEAKILKESIDRRSVNVSNILSKYLNLEEYADYDHFINMKAKLIMDSREIGEKIKLGEEQLLALKATLTNRTD